MNVFFVCGAPKSGTTWLQRIFDAHPEVCCSGEGHFVERFTGPMAQVVRAYNDGLAMEAEQVYEGRPPYQPVTQDAFDQLARAFILQRMTERAPQGVRFVGDKTPRYTHVLEQLSRIFPQAKFVHIVRDPRDVAASRLGHNARIGLADAFVFGSKRHAGESEAAARGWLEAVDRVDAFAAAHPGQVHELRYDALHKEPAAEIAKAFDFLGASVNRPLVDAIARATSFEAITGRKAGEEDPKAFLRKGVPGDWKARLAAETAARIVEVCGEAMRRKGFLDDDAAIRAA